MIIGTINYDCNRQLADLDLVKFRIVNGTNLIEAKLKKDKTYQKELLIQLKDCFLIKYQTNAIFRLKHSLQ